MCFGEIEFVYTNSNFRFRIPERSEGTNEMAEHGERHERS